MFKILIEVAENIRTRTSMQWQLKRFLLRTTVEMGYEAWLLYKYSDVTFWVLVLDFLNFLCELPDGLCNDPSSPLNQIFICCRIMIFFSNVFFFLFFSPFSLEVNAFVGKCFISFRNQKWSLGATWSYGLMVMVSWYGLFLLILLINFSNNSG